MNRRALARMAAAASLVGGLLVFLAMIALLAAFGLATVLFWAWFRYRPARAAVP